MRSKTLFWILFIAYLSDLLIIIKTSAQTNPCPEISSATIISPQNLSLFDTPNGDRQVAYMAQPNETLELLNTKALWVNGTCWYRIQSPEGVPYSDLWLATQPASSESPLETPSPSPEPSPSLSPSPSPSPLSSPSPDNLLSTPPRNIPPLASPSPSTEARSKPPKTSPQPQRRKPKPSRKSSTQANQAKKQLKKATKSVQNSPKLDLINPAILIYFTLSSFLGIITFLYSLSLSIQIKRLSAQNRKLLKTHQDSITMTQQQEENLTNFSQIIQKQEEKLIDFSQTIVDVEKRLISQLQPSAVDPLAIDLEITNLLRKKGPMPLSSLTALSPHDPDLLQQRLDLLQQESLVKKQALNDTDIYSLFALTPAEQQLVTLILAFNQQHLTYFQEQRSQPLNRRENSSPRQLEKATDLATAHYLRCTIETEHWLIPNILSPEIAQIMRHLIDFPDLFTIIPGSGSLYLIKPAKLYPLDQDLEKEFWGIAEIGEFQWLNPTT